MAVKIDVSGLERALRKISASVTKREIEQIGDAAITAMKSDIASGLSPVRGRGRFPGYKRASQGGYPYTVKSKYPSKRERPVNLSLSGDFLDSLRSKAIAQRSDSDGTTYGLEIGLSDPLSRLKEQGHREGANGQPSRPIIPTSAEGFSQSIQAVIQERFLSLLKAAIKRSP